MVNRRNLFPHAIRQMPLLITTELQQNRVANQCYIIKVGILLRSENRRQGKKVPETNTSRRPEVKNRLEVVGQTFDILRRRERRGNSFKKQLFPTQGLACRK